MTVSFSPIRNSLNIASAVVDSYKVELDRLQEHKVLLTKLDKALRKELESTPHQTFNWELHEENRALLDQIYDANLVEGFEEKVYAFDNPEKTMHFVQSIQRGLESKASDIQNQTQLHHDKKQQMMQFYQQLLDIISKLGNILSSITYKI